VAISKKEIYSHPLFFKTIRHRKMRREEREIKDKTEIERIIQKALVCRVALSDGGSPYVVPVCFGFKDGVIYFHSAQEGKKIEILRKNNKVCFEMDIDIKLIEGEKGCAWGIQYSSVIGYGTASFIEENEEKKKALHILLGHYSDKTYEFPEPSLNEVAVIKIRVESMTGKKAALGG
jgi:nitroimidazol reductase NimA-like FMN-containing flavoprotein (pyridoxamine 5'-phosphate oxidase superfamily)